MNDPIASFDESVLGTFPGTLESLAERGVLIPTVTLDRLKPLLSTGQQAIFDQIINLKPQDSDLRK
jgi:hypothetical protein